MPRSLSLSMFALAISAWSLTALAAMPPMHGGAPGQPPQQPPQPGDQDPGAHHPPPPPDGGQPGDDQDPVGLPGGNPGMAQCGPGHLFAGGHRALGLAQLMVAMDGLPPQMECATATVEPNLISIHFDESCEDAQHPVGGAVSLGYETQEDRSILTLIANGLVLPPRPNGESPSVSGTLLLSKGIGWAEYSAQGVLWGDALVDGALTITAESLTTHHLVADFAGTLGEAPFTATADLRRVLDNEGRREQGTLTSVVGEEENFSATVDVLFKPGCRYPVGIATITQKGEAHEAVFDCDTILLDGEDPNPGEGAPMGLGLGKMLGRERMLCALREAHDFLNGLADKNLMCPFCPGGERGPAQGPRHQPPHLPGQPGDPVGQGGRPDGGGGPMHPGPGSGGQ